MNALVALFTLIRTATVFAVVVVLAFGAMTANSSAEDAHHASEIAVDGTTYDASEAAVCSESHALELHDAGDSFCCIGTCTTILVIVPDAPISAGRISQIEPFEAPVLAQTSTVEFIRPPRL